MRSAWPFLGLLSLGALLAALGAGVLSTPSPVAVAAEVSQQPSSPANPTPTAQATPSAAAEQTTQPATTGKPSVTADAGMVTIESDSQQADNRTGVITATGNVRISYPDGRTVATSRQAQYYSKEGRLILSGDVDVVDADGQRIRAERLVYRLESERLVAEPTPGRQVYSRLRLQTRKGTGSSAPAPTLMP